MQFDCASAVGGEAFLSGCPQMPRRAIFVPLVVAESSETVICGADLIAVPQDAPLANNSMSRTAGSGGGLFRCHSLSSLPLSAISPFVSFVVVITWPSLGSSLC